MKYRKGLWCRIEIKGNQMLGDFDHIMREAFNHDTGDHLSEFFSGRVWHSERFGEIEPGGSGSGAKKQIDQLGLIEGNTIEYVYDFGDDRGCSSWKIFAIRTGTFKHMASFWSWVF